MHKHVIIVCYYLEGLQEAWAGEELHGLRGPGVCVYGGSGGAVDGVTPRFHPVDRAGGAPLTLLVMNNIRV